MKSPNYMVFSIWSSGVDLRDVVVFEVILERIFAFCRTTNTSHKSALNTQPKGIVMLVIHVEVIVKWASSLFKVKIVTSLKDRSY